jgi:peptide/histidine transporter 3/4
MKLSFESANMLALFWKGTGYITPLLGGYLADTYLGRFKAIIIFILFYVLSMALLAIGVIDAVLATQMWVAYLGLFLIDIAMGGIKANVVTFGADQFRNYSEDTQEAFFNWFYFSINCGTIISFTVVAYVQQNIGFSVGYAIPAGVMFLSAILFLIGSKFYIKLPPSGSILSKCASIVSNCIKIGKGTSAPSFLDRGYYVHDTLGNRMFTDQEIEDLKTFVRVLPVLATFIMFWCLYAQMSSVMYSQGTVMNLSVGTFALPLSVLQVFNSAFILILVPLFDRILYPYLRKRKINFNQLRKIGAGLLLANTAMLYSGVLEIFRRDMYAKGDYFKQSIGEITVDAVDLSVFWQAPAFMLIGAAEVLASITGLQFAYDESPTSMRSMVQAMFLVTTGLGSYLGSMIVAIVNAISKKITLD